MALSLVAPSELSLVSLIQKAQDEKAQSEAAHVASDANADTASVSIALPAQKQIARHTIAPQLNQRESSNESYRGGKGIGCDDWNTRCVLTDHSQWLGRGPLLCAVGRV